jgi:hypothetical protein
MKKLVFALLATGLMSSVFASSPMPANGGGKLCVIRATKAIPQGDKNPTVPTCLDINGNVATGAEAATSASSGNMTTYYVLGAAGVLVAAVLVANSGSSSSSGTTGTH